MWSLAKKVFPTEDKFLMDSIREATMKDYGSVIVELEALTADPEFLRTIIF